MDTYGRIYRLSRVLYSSAKNLKRKLGRIRGMGRHSTLGRAYIDFGRPDRGISSSYHVGYEYSRARFRRTMPLRDPHAATSDRRNEDQATGTEVSKPLLPWNASMVILVRFCDLLQEKQEPVCLMI